MSDVQGFPYFEFQVGKGGEVIDPAERQRALDFFAGGQVTDMVVMSHGWNNDMDQARALYDRFLAETRKLLTAGTPSLGTRKLGVLAVLWPSKKFADDDLIPGQAASVNSSGMIKALDKQMVALLGGFDAPDADDKLTQARALLPKLADSPQAQRDFVNLVRGLLGAPPANDEGANDQFFNLDGDKLLGKLKEPVILPRVVGAGTVGGAQSLGTAAGAGGVSGGAASIGSFFSGIASAANNLLNLTTYYQMKERAGVLGRGTAAALVREIASSPKAPKVHMWGHSFGCRLVTSVALGPDDQPPATYASMTLLQAAFSHNGFSDGSDKHPKGFFRDVVNAPPRISGPIVITHTGNDRAVGLAYPLASRLAGQEATALGDPGDKYGGLGRNGAQGTPEAVMQNFGNVGTAYGFKSGRIYNLMADKVIFGHSDIVHPETAYAFLSAVAAT